MPPGNLLQLSLEMLFFYFLNKDFIVTYGKVHYPIEMPQSIFLTRKNLASSHISEIISCIKILEPSFIKDKFQLL